MLTVNQTETFSEWLADLKDKAGRSRIQMRIDRLELGNPGNSRGVGGSVSELKIDVGPGYRVYYTQIGELVVVLLCGGDKSTQQNDIERAQEMAAALRKEAQ